MVEKCLFEDMGPKFEHQKIIYFLENYFFLGFHCQISNCKKNIEIGNIFFQNYEQSRNDVKFSNLFGKLIMTNKMLVYNSIYYSTEYSLNYASEPFFRESRDQALICNSKLWYLGLTLKFKSAHINYRD